MVQYDGCRQFSTGPLPVLLRHIAYRGHASSVPGVGACPIPQPELELAGSGPLCPVYPLQLPVHVIRQQLISANPLFDIRRAVAFIGELDVLEVYARTTTQCEQPVAKEA